MEVAGLILIRQKPGSAKGVLFVTIEDETGVANAIIWPHRLEANRRTILSSAMIVIRGRVQREGEVIHVIMDDVEDYTHRLWSIGQTDFPHRPVPVTVPRTEEHPMPEKSGRLRSATNTIRHSRTGADPEDVVKVKTRDFR